MTDISPLRQTLLTYMEQAAKGTMHDSYLPASAWPGLLDLIEDSLVPAGHREVRRAPGFSDDGVSYPIAEHDLYEGRKYIRPDKAAWTECEPLYRLKALQ